MRWRFGGATYRSSHRVDVLIPQVVVDMPAPLSVQKETVEVVKFFPIEQISQWVCSQIVGDPDPRIVVDVPVPQILKDIVEVVRASQF